MSHAPARSRDLPSLPRRVAVAALAILPLHLMLALALLSQDQLDAGRREIRTLLEHDPAQVEARRTLDDPGP